MSIAALHIPASCRRKRSALAADVRTKYQARAQAALTRVQDCHVCASHSCTNQAIAAGAARRIWAAYLAARLSPSDLTASMLVRMKPRVTSCEGINRCVHGTPCCGVDGTNLRQARRVRDIHLAARLHQQQLDRRAAARLRQPPRAAPAASDTCTASVHPAQCSSAWSKRQRNVDA